MRHYVSKKPPCTRSCHPFNDSGSFTTRLISISGGGFVMRSKFLLVAALAVVSTVAVFLAQEAPREKGPWRGVGPTPCEGKTPDIGFYTCPQVAGSVAVRAGRLFDSKTGQMLTKQVVLIMNDRITDVGPEAQIKIPAGARVIDLSQATVMPGLI